MGTGTKAAPWVVGALATATLVSAGTVALRGGDELVVRDDAVSAGVTGPVAGLPPRPPVADRDRPLATPSPAAATSGATAGAAGPTTGPTSVAVPPPPTTRATPPKRATTPPAKPRPAAAPEQPAPAPAAKPSSPQPAARPPAGGGDVASYEAELLERLNAERTQRGLHALRLSGCPDEMAGSHARRQAEQNRMHHQPMDPVLDRCGGTSAGENVAAGPMSPQEMVRRWMASPGHRDNVLRERFTHLGVGVARGSDGRWYASTVFHTP